MNAELFGLNIDTLSFKEALDKARVLIDTPKVSQVVTINPEMFEFSSKDEDFSNILKEAEMIIPDGIGVKIALKINGINSERIPGIDFAKEEVITTAINNLKKEISGLNIVYYHNGYFDDDTTIYNEINSKSPKLILVAMGSPRQEKFIYNAKNILKPALMIGIGGSLDVWSGTVKRAPKLFQDLGIEWLYRTLTHPSRLKRIFPTLPMFLLKAINYKISK